MKVRELIKRLEVMNQDMSVLMDADENGWYDVRLIEGFEDEDGNVSVNLVSSCEY